jgi:hypothetical protein
MSDILPKGDYSPDPTDDIPFGFRDPFWDELAEIQDLIRLNSEPVPADMLVEIEENDDAAERG